MFKNKKKFPFVNAMRENESEQRYQGATMKTLGNNEFESFGHYIFLKKLAQGGMAEVFLARPSSQDANGRVQVVKRILPHVATHSAFLNMFQREIRIIMGFNHPHIVQLHDFGSVENQPFIAMEYIEGKSLKDIMLRFRSLNQKIPIPVALSLAAQAASGLSYAHEFVNKITGEELHAVHRDISPHNLIVTYEGNLKVIDFGIAKAACSVHDLTQTGVIKGKAAYFAPEQLTGQNIDARTDIFALGIVLWEMLTGERLFVKEGDSEITTMQKVSNCERHIVAPSIFNNDIPTDIDAIVLSALKKDPENRISTAKEFQQLLREAMLRHYPAFSYNNVGEMMHLIFGHDMEAERSGLRHLNDEVQKALVGSIEEKTQTITTTATNTALTAEIKPSYIKVIASGTGHHTQFQPVAASDATTSNVDMRLSNIEKMMKQKATARHYVMLAIYIVALVGIKITERWDFTAQDKAEAAEPMEMVRKTAEVTKPLADVTKPIYDRTQRQIQQAVKTSPVSIKKSAPQSKKMTSAKKVKNLKRRALTK